MFCLNADDVTVNLLGGDDAVIDVGANNTSDLGDGDDTFVGTGGDGATVDGGTGADSITGSPGDDEITAGDGDDTLIGAEGDDTLNGGQGADQLQGDAGADTLFGESGADTLQGGDGDDVLAGGEDIDTLNGGSGINMCDYQQGEPLTTTCTYDDAGPVVSAVSFSPSTVDVGSSSATTRLSFRVTDATAIDQGSVSCGSFAAGFRKSDTEWISWWHDGVNTTLFQPAPVTDGGKSYTFDQEVTIPFGSVPGDRQCSGWARDSIANAGSSGGPATLTINRTPAGQPSEPRSLSFAADRPTSGVLSWGVPAVVGSPALTGYIAQFSTDGTTWQDLPNGVTAARSVRVSSLLPDTNYWFRVRGENGGTAGQDTTFMNLKWATVKVRTPAPTVASAPRALRVLGVTSSGFTLAWSAPAYNGGAAITDFSVETSRDNGATWVSVKNTVSTSQVLKVTGAAPGTKYLVRVAAINPVGASPYLTGEVTTAQSAPTAPQKLTVGKLTSSSAVLTWSLPASNGGSAITDYRVETSRDGRTWTVVPRTASTSRSIRITGMAPGTSYRVRVSAVNAIGVGPAVTGNVTTLPAKPSAPQNLTVGTVTSSSVVLTWSLPASNGGSAITDYRVETSRDGITWTVAPRAVSTSRAIRITGLTPAATYRVRVSAINAVGVGPALTGRVTTLPVKPSAPQNLTVGTVTSSSVVLTWSLPTSNGGSAITDYRVETSRDGITWTVVPRTVSASRYVRITGLKPGATYRVRVSAINTIGVGPALAGKVTTLPAKPSAPQNLTASNVSSSSLTLNWEPPASNGGSALTDFKIEVSSNCSTHTAIPHPVSTAPGFNVVGLSAGTKYCFRVSAINAVGTSPASPPLQVATQ